MYLADTPPVALEPRVQSPPLRPPIRVDERTLAYAVAEWFGGEDFSLQDAMWIPAEGLSVMLRAEGDRLLHRGDLIATRGPPQVHEGRRSGALSEARAVCRVVLRGDHLRLYPHHQSRADYKRHDSGEKLCGDRLSTPFIKLA